MFDKETTNLITACLTTKVTYTRYQRVDVSTVGDAFPRHCYVVADSFEDFPYWVLANWLIFGDKG